MNGKQIALTNLMISLTVLLAIAIAGVFALLDPGDMAILGWALTGFVIVTCFARPFPGAGAVVTVIAIAVFFGAQGYRMVSAAGVGLELSLSALQSSYFPAAPNYLPLAFAGALCFAAAGWLSDAVARQLRGIQAQMQQYSTMIRELTVHDDVTGTLKPVYADTKLSEEIERARRYNHAVSVVMLGVDDWPAIPRDRGSEETAAVLRTIGEVLKNNVRQVDSISHREESRFLAILPETRLAGAQTVAERLCREVVARSPVTFRAGVAEFPSDAASKTELLSEAAAALKFARNADITVASHGLLV